MKVFGAVSTVSQLASRLTQYVCIVMIYVMLALLSTQVLMRYFLGSPPTWTEEVAIILFAWVVLLYATVGVRERFHVAIDFLPESMHRLRWVSNRLVAMTIGVFGLIILWSGVAYALRTAGQKTAALRLPIEFLYLSVPVCGALLLLHATAIFIEPDPTGAQQEIDI